MAVGRILLVLPISHAQFCRAVAPENEMLTLHGPRQARGRQASERYRIGPGGATPSHLGDRTIARISLVQ